MKNEKKKETLGVDESVETEELNSLPGRQKSTLSTTKCFHHFSARKKLGSPADWSISAVLSWK